MDSNTFLVCSGVALALTLGACGRNGTALGRNAATTDTASTATAPASADMAASPATNAAPAPAGAPSTATAQGFVTTAAITDMYEIAAAKVAAQRSKNEAVEAFAAKMIRDHSATTVAVKKIAASGGAAVTPPDAMDDAHAAMITALQGAPAGTFDKTYMDQQVTAHNAAVALFKTYAAQGDNPALKSFAQDTEPKIEQHLNMAQKLDASTTMG